MAIELIVENFHEYFVLMAASASSQMSHSKLLSELIFENNYLVLTTPPKNGEIALFLTTNSLMCSKYISQKRNAAIDNGQWYNMLLNFIL